MFKYLNIALAGLACFVFGACSEDDMENIAFPSEEHSIPVNFNVGINGYENSRAAEQWPDSACVVVYSITTNNIFGYLVYSKTSDTWTATIKSAAVNRTGEQCRLYYVKVLKKSWYKDASKLPDCISTDMIFCHYHGGGKYNFKTSPAEFDVFGTLEPRTGRFRLKSDVKKSWRWTFKQLEYVPGADIRPIFGYTDLREMTQSADDNWYTPYLYAETLPEFIDERGNVYQYANPTRKLEPGQSVVIDAPAEPFDTKTWKSRLLSGHSGTTSNNVIKIGPENPYELFSCDYTNESGFRLFGKYAWMPDTDTEVVFDSINNTPFHFVVVDKDGNRSIYYPPVENSEAKENYTFDISINDTSIRQILLEEDYFKVGVGIFSYTLQYK